MAKTLKQYRDQRLMSVPEFAKHLGIAADTLYRIQKGERPRNSTMRDIASRLGVTPAEVEEFRTHMGIGDVNSEQIARIAEEHRERFLSAIARAEREGWLTDDDLARLDREHTTKEAAAV